MTNDDMQNINSTDQKSAKFGAYLQSRRESMGLDRKDAAAQLRLSERVIEILETENYPTDLPITFIRGYLRSYSKLLQIADQELNAALEPIQPPKQSVVQMDRPIVINDLIKATGMNYYMQFSTYAIAATVAALVGMWWYNHTPSPSSVQTETHALAFTSQSMPNNNASPTDTQAAPPAPSSTNTPVGAHADANNLGNQAKPPMLASPTSQAKPDTVKQPATNRTANPPSYASKRPAYDDDDDDYEPSRGGSSD